MTKTSLVTMIISGMESYLKMRTEVSDLKTPLRALQRRIINPLLEELLVIIENLMVTALRQDLDPLPLFTVRGSQHRLLGETP